MTFNDATISFRSGMGASCSQFEILARPIQMTVSGPSKYIHLKLDDEQTRRVNALAKQVGIEYENSPAKMKFMTYSGTFLPGRVKEANSSREATLEEKEAFGQIFDIARTSIATQKGWLVDPSDVAKIVLEKTVDFIAIKQACRLRIELSQSAVDRLDMDHDSNFREYGKSSSNDAGAMAMIVYPGQL